MRFGADFDGENTLEQIEIKVEMSPFSFPDNHIHINEVCSSITSETTFISVDCGFVYGSCCFCQSNLWLLRGKLYPNTRAGDFSFIFDKLTFFSSFRLYSRNWILTSSSKFWLLCHYSNLNLIILALILISPKLFSSLKLAQTHFHII